VGFYSSLIACSQEGFVSLTDVLVDGDDADSPPRRELQAAVQEAQELLRGVAPGDLFRFFLKTEKNASSIQATLWAAVQRPSASDSLSEGFRFRASLPTKLKPEIESPYAQVSVEVREEDLHISVLQRDRAVNLGEPRPLSPQAPTCSAVYIITCLALRIATVLQTLHFAERRDARLSITPKPEAAILC
jgi:hypothetical protein